MTTDQPTPGDRTEGRRRPPSVAPWARTRLRASRGAALALALLVLTLTFLAAALPRELDRYQDQALNRTLSAAGATSGVEGTADLGGTYPQGTPAQLAPAALAADGLPLQRDIRPPLVAVRQPADDGVHTLGTDDTLTDAWLPQPSDLPARLNLDWQPDQAAHVRLLSGRLPDDPPPATADTTPLSRFPTLEIAVSAATAQTMHLRTGSLLHLRPAQADPVELRVVGVFQPLDPGQVYWQAEPGLLQADLRSMMPSSGGTPLYYWHFEGLVAAGASPYLPALGAAQAYWWYPLVPGSLSAGEVGAAQNQLADLTSGVDEAQLQSLPGLPQGVTVVSALPALLSGFSTQSEALSPVLAIGAAGTAGVAAAVLLMAAGLAADRRGAEIALLRARGGSLPALARRLLRETLACTTAGAAVGTALALLLLPAPRWHTALLAAATVWALATVSVPLRTLARHRRQRASTRADSLLTARPSRRRTVAELTAVVAAVAAVVSVRRRGVVSGVGIDPLLTGAPLLLALAGALLLLRLYPWPLRAAARPAGRGSGAIGFLGLARAGRAAGTVALLPLLALLLALTIGTFGTQVVSGVSDARTQQAVDQVGADASLTPSVGQLPDPVVSAAEHSPGVRSATSVQVDLGEELPSAGIIFQLDSVDPAAYSTLARRAGLGALPAALLRYRGSGPVPVLASVRLAAALGTRPRQLGTAYGTLRVQVVATADSSLSNQPGEFLVVPRQALPDRPGNRPRGLQILLLSGPVKGAALRAAVSGAAGGADVAVAVASEVEAAAVQAAPQSAGAENLYLWTVLAAALLSVLAVLLALLQAAPGRGALLARLRTMGLTPRQGYRLIMVEALPQLLLGVAAGTGLGLATVPLFGSALDLSSLVGIPGSDPAAGAVSLRLQPLPLLGPALGLLALAVAVVAVEAAVVGRRQISAELRAGDQR